MNGQHRRPEFANDQCAKILQLLREAGLRGVSKEFLVFECRYTQAAARVFELERRGYEIRHEQRPGDRYTTFVLISEPASPKPDWYERETGKPRSSADNSGLPLFVGTADV